MINELNFDCCCLGIQIHLLLITYKLLLIYYLASAAVKVKVKDIIWPRSAEAWLTDFYNGLYYTSQLAYTLQYT